MPTYIALLRGINVGGRNRVSMADLVRMATDLGFGQAKTILQSGNLVFTAEERPIVEIEDLLEAETERLLNCDPAYIVLTADELSQAVAANPYPEEAAAMPNHLIVVFMKRPIVQSAVVGLQAAIKGREHVTAIGRFLYAIYPDGIGESKLTIKLIESKLEAIGTGRNWNTVLKLQQLADSGSAKAQGE